MSESFEKFPFTLPKVDLDADDWYEQEQAAKAQFMRALVRLGVAAELNSDFWDDLVALEDAAQTYLTSEDFEEVTRRVNAFIEADPELRDSRATKQHEAIMSLITQPGFEEAIDEALRAPKPKPELDEPDRSDW